MNIIKIIVLLVLAVCCNFICFSQQKPNVLFIAIDDLNDYVGCMNGSVRAYTPNIDRLAATGVLFANAHCQAPICGPSRASIMSGLAPSTSGNYLQLGDKDILKGNKKSAQSVLMPDYFEQYGYKTMAVGKIYHQGDADNTFDEYGGNEGSYGPKPEKRQNYDPRKIPGKIGNTMTDWGAYPKHDSLMTDFKSAKWAVAKLKEKHDKPFFLAVGFYRPHNPWHVPKKWFDMYPKDKITLPPYNKNDFDDIPPFARKVTAVPMMPTTEELMKAGEWKDILQAYLASITFVDAQVGKVLNALENSVYKEDTMIVLWSDHGYAMGEKNRFAKHALWERDTRTILIFKVIGTKKSKVSHAPVQLIDIYPTLVDLCGLPKYETADGHSLLPLLNNPNKKWLHPALSFYGIGNVSIRSKKYRLINYEDGSQEFYNMRKDKNEWENLASKKKHEKKINRLKQWIPKDWAPLSRYSRYSVNPYFKSKSKVRN